MRMNKFYGKEFVCLDCETTGLDPEQDRVIEVAAVRYTVEGPISRFETLIDPERDIPEESIKIHHITEEMVKNQPKIEAVLPSLFEFIGQTPIVGHGIGFDIHVLAASAKRAQIPSSIEKNVQIDTLRMARLYGRSSTNSLVALRDHFGIDLEIAHRAMGDVLVNIDVFLHLLHDFKSYPELIEVLSKPVKMKEMPLGKYRGRRFDEIPLNYLKWASYQKFDEDLIFSIRSELKQRKKGGTFGSNPFKDL